MKNDVHIATKAVHCGRESRNVPTIDLATTTRIENLAEAIDSIEAMNQGQIPTHNSIYSRLHNDTVAGFERAFAQLEGAESAVAFSSGMAAINTLLLNASQQGGHIIAMRPIYGASDHLLSNNLCNTQVSWCSVENFTQAIQQNTALIMIETPANPTCSLVDIHAVVNKAKGIPVAVDSTFASPIIQQPLRWGAAYSLHSATKFIGGHSDVLGGVVACSEDLAQQLRKLRIYTGGCLHPLSGYLLHRGLQTLELRVREAQNNATIIAKRLQQHPAVKTVFHPSMTSCDPNGLVGRQMQGPGAMLAINVHGGFTKAAQVMKKVRLITPAVSLGSVDTLIQHPAGLTHRNSAFIQENKSSINDSMLRISIGIEHVEDLWDDLNNALGDGTSDKKEWDQA